MRGSWVMVVAGGAWCAVAMAGEGAPTAGVVDAVPAWKQAYDAWQYPQPVPDFELVNQEGRPLRLGALADRYVLVGFVFSRCPMPKACPLTMTRFAQVQTAWKAAVSSGKTRGRKLALLGITLDPEFDKPAVLKSFASRYGADFSMWTMATGPTELVQSALPSLFAVLALPGGPGVVNHSVKVALLSPGLRIQAEWPDNEFTAEDIINRVILP